MFLKGPHSVICQSGGVTLYLAERFSEERLGVRILVSEGNKLDLDEADLLPFLAEDPETRVIFLYMEGITRGRELLEAAARSPKPVVVLKANVAEASAQIARSHTAALATDERLVDAAFRQAGILRVHDLEQFLLCAKAFALPPLRGENVAVACMSGGMSVVAADACARHGLYLPPLPPDLLRELERRGRGGVVHLRNPLDLGDIHDPSVMLLVLETVLALPDIHGAAFCLPSPAGSGRVIGGGLVMEGIVGRVQELSRAHEKPVALSFFAGRRAVEPLLGTAEMPVFWSITESIEALALQRAFWRWRDHPRSLALPAGSTRDPPGGLPCHLRRSGGASSLLEVLGFLRASGFPVEEVRMAKTPEEAAAVAERLGYPVALKLLSPDVSHKTDVSGVALHLTSRGDVEAAFRKILDAARAKAPGAEIQGVGIQRMCVGGQEVIVGARRDPAFGPVVLFGLGGIWTEALGDIALRLAPISPEDAREMIGELRGAAVLGGFRGLPPADIDALVSILLLVSRLVVEVSRIRELDLNPVMVWREGARVLDARMFIEGEDVAARVPGHIEGKGGRG